MRSSNSLIKQKRSEKEHWLDLADANVSTFLGKMNKTGDKKGKDFHRNIPVKKEPQEEIEQTKSYRQIKKEKKEEISSCTNHKHSIVQKRIKNYEQEWEQLLVEKEELQLKYCFLIGQEFCFKEVETDMYIGFVNKNIYCFKETDRGVFYQCLFDSEYIFVENQEESYEHRQSKKERYISELRAFFNLQFPLQQNIELWKKKDQRIKEITQKVRGLRILKIDPIESFFSFLCSANNNISRITLMIECLRRRYGNHIAEIVFEEKDIVITIEKRETTKNQIRETIFYRSIPFKSKIDVMNKRIKKETNNNPKKNQRKSEIYHNNNSVSNDSSLNENRLFYENMKEIIKEEKILKKFNFFEFPSVETLSTLQEEDLRNLGFGYRSNYIITSARMLESYENRNWIEDFKKETKTINVINKLLKYPGVGLKVANCICLFGLNRFDCIPIDTHIYDIIYKHYTNVIEGITKKTTKKKTQSRKNKDNGRNNKKERSAQQMKKKISILKNTDPTTTNSKQKKKALTRSLYMKLFKEMENLFGPNCGWAQTILFVSELKKFQNIFQPTYFIFIKALLV